MKRYKPKRRAIQYQIDKAKREIREERPAMCEGCGRWDKPLDVSHHIALSTSLDYAADKRNMALMCRDCRKRVEAGKWHLLNNGDQIIEYIAPREPQLLLKADRH